MKKDLGSCIALWGEEIRGIAQNGLLFAENDYDRARYQRLQEIAGEMAAAVTGEEPSALLERFRLEPGYATPKVGVAAALFDEEDRILLIQRADNRLWAMPGGWADIGFSPAQVAVKEVYEETGLTISVTRLIGLYDGRSNNFKNFFHLYHLVFEGRVTGGEITLAPDETLAASWYKQNELPPLSPGHDRAIRDAFLRRHLKEAFFDPPR